MKIDHAVANPVPLLVTADQAVGGRSGSLLGRIHNPGDLHRLQPAQLPALCQEIRAYLLNSVARSGGHFASSLGVVELSVALHHVFDTGRDRIVWDVGHQAYVHKMLTGRRSSLGSIRKPGGIAGFPSRAESAHDAFGTAHSSTSISAILGLAVAAKIESIARHHVAVIGDGALTAGMAYEALCQAIDAGVDAIIVVNDNQMSISGNVGALPRHLQALVERRGGAGSNLFDALGLPYTGPVNGHDVGLLIDRLTALREAGGVQILHIRTRKGQGYSLAEQDPIAYHGPSPFDPVQGLVRSQRHAPPTFSQIFGAWACERARHDAGLVVITPAMAEGSGLVGFANEHPNRFFDVGIAEQHALTFAAGMACDGVRPVVAIYSTFLQRAYDQLIHDIALQNLPVMLAIDRAGLVGADGPTHAGSFDLAFLRTVPNLVIMTPSDETECRMMLDLGMTLPGPSAVRYPRGGGPGNLPVGEALPRLETGQARYRRRGQSVAILAFGTMLAEAQAAGEHLDATVVDMRFVKPLDRAMLVEVCSDHELIVTVEEGSLMGGAGSAVQEELGELLNAGDINCAPPVLRLGLPDRFLAHGDSGEMLARCGLDAAGITAAVGRRLLAGRGLRRPHPVALPREFHCL